jgi:predicted mannosyl-3-phosphoglycerate phosphatase (HAD superfamily)
MESKRMAKLKEQRNKFDEICKNKNFVELTDEEMKNIRG